MQHKRDRGYDPDVPPARRLRANVVDLFMSGHLSGNRTHELLADATAAGAEGVRDLAPGASSHASRDLTRRLLKGCQWPEPYFFPCRVWNIRSQREELVDMPMLLPHELVQALALARSSTIEELCSTANMSANTKAHVERIKADIGCAALLGMGLWGDGVPFNYDRSESIEVLTVSLPGLSSRLRIPLIGVGKRYSLGSRTWDDVCRVVAWSFQACLQARMPTKRHDGSDFGHSERARGQLAGQSIATRCILAEVRGDWAWLKSIFHFPQFNEKKGCCWKCRVLPDGIRDCGETAAWRSQPLSHFDFVLRLNEQNIEMNPLFSSPFLTTSQFLIDWLHVADLGVGADVAGNVLLTVSKAIPGGNAKQRVQHLYEQLVTWYDLQGSTDRLQSLTTTMIKQPNKPPKLRGSAAQIRGTIGFLPMVVAAWLDLDSDEGKCVLAMARHLHACYQCLVNYDAHELRENSRKLCVLWAAMEASQEEGSLLWRVKPKMHLWQHMCEESSSSPALAWTYADEDIAGALATMSQRRGGANRTKTIALTLLQKFRAKYTVPALP